MELRDRRVGLVDSSYSDVMYFFIVFVLYGITAI